LESLKAALRKASFVSIRTKLTRLVPQLDLRVNSKVGVTQARVGKGAG
jgi:hypothetical protein